MFIHTLSFCAYWHNGPHYCMGLGPIMLRVGLLFGCHMVSRKKCIVFEPAAWTGESAEGCLRYFAWSGLQTFVGGTIRPLGPSADQDVDEALLTSSSSLWCVKGLCFLLMFDKLFIYFYFYLYLTKSWFWLFPQEAVWGWVICML